VSIDKTSALLIIAAAKKEAGAAIDAAMPKFDRMIAGRIADEVAQSEIKAFASVAQTIKGDKGDQGEKGDAGKDGIDGAKGEPGERGPKGDTGERGRNGDKGDIGPKGDPGLNGKDGSDGTSVAEAAIGDDGHLYIGLTDGRVMDAGRARGKDGKDGTNGRTIIGGGGSGSGSGGGGDGITALTGDVTATGPGSAAATIADGAITSAKIADDAVGNDKLANMATASLKGRTTAGTGDPEDLTGTQATALLDAFTSGAKGLAPASGGGSANFLRADGTWAAPAGGTPGGSSGEVQYNNAGAFAGAADVEIEGGQLRLPAIATPTTPAAGGIKLFTKTALGQRDWPHILLPNGKEFGLQESLCEFQINQFRPNSYSTGVLGDGSLAQTATGTATAGVAQANNLFVMFPRIEARVGAPATNAVAGFRAAGNFARIGRDANAPGGFYSTQMWGPSTGLPNSTHRAFCGHSNNTAAPTDVEPSSLTDMIGMGWDAADTNVQIMHNDGSGTATKIDLGANFPVPNTTNGAVYQLELFSPNDLAQSVEYRVTLFNTTDKTAAFETTGTITTNIPAVATLLSPRTWCSVGGTSSIVGVALFGACVCREY